MTYLLPSLKLTLEHCVSFFECTLAPHVSKQKVTLISHTVTPCELALSTLITVLELPLVFVAVDKLLSAHALWFIVHPVASIGILAVSIVIDTLALQFGVGYVTPVVATLGKYCDAIHGLAVALLEYSFVVHTRLEYGFTFAVW